MSRPGRHLAALVQRFQYGLFFDVAVIHVQARGPDRHPDRSYRWQVLPQGGRALGPNRTPVVTFPCIGYAKRPFRTTDGMEPERGLVK